MPQYVISVLPFILEFRISSRCQGISFCVYYFSKQWVCLHSYATQSCYVMGGAVVVWMVHSMSYSKVCPCQTK